MNIEQRKAERGSEEIKDFSGAQTFEELYAAIDEVGGLQGSLKFYSAEELKQFIEEFREGKLDNPLKITNVGGLRKKVIDLLTEERSEQHQVDATQ